MKEVTKNEILLKTVFILLTCVASILLLYVNAFMIPYVPFQPRGYIPELLFLPMGIVFVWNLGVMNQRHEVMLRELREQDKKKAWHGACKEVNRINSDEEGYRE